MLVLFPFLRSTFKKCFFIWKKGVAERKIACDVSLCKFPPNLDWSRLKLGVWNPILILHMGVRVPRSRHYMLSPISGISRRQYWKKSGLGPHPGTQTQDEGIPSGNLTNTSVLAPDIFLCISTIHSKSFTVLETWAYDVFNVVSLSICFMF